MLLLCFSIVFESCNQLKPACGNRRAHKQRTHKMKRTGMWM